MSAIADKIMNRIRGKGRGWVFTLGISLTLAHEARSMWRFHA